MTLIGSCIDVEEIVQPDANSQTLKIFEKKSVDHHVQVIFGARSLEITLPILLIHCVYYRSMVKLILFMKNNLLVLRRDINSEWLASN